MKRNVLEEVVPIVCIVAIAVTTVFATVVGAVKVSLSRRVEDVENEAVNRGYAEIVIDEDGSRVFRWKEEKEKARGKE